MSKGQTLASSNGETGRTVRTALEMLGIAGDARILCTEALPINANLAEFIHEDSCINKPPLPLSDWEPLHSYPLPPSNVWQRWLHVLVARPLLLYGRLTRCS